MQEKEKEKQLGEARGNDKEKLKNRAIGKIYRGKERRGFSMKVFTQW